MSALLDLAEPCDRSSADIFRDMFLEKWGHGAPPASCRVEYERDLASLRFLEKHGARAAIDVAG